MVAAIDDRPVGSVLVHASSAAASAARRAGWQERPCTSPTYSTASTSVLSAAAAELSRHSKGPDWGHAGVLGGSHQQRCDACAGQQVGRRQVTVALRFGLADHAGGRARDVGIDHAADVEGGVRGGWHRTGQVVQVDQSGGVATFPGELTAMASVRSTGPVSTANTRRSADQARDSPASAIIGACTRASSSRAVSAFCRAHANSARSYSAVRGQGAIIGQ